MATPQATSTPIYSLVYTSLSIEPMTDEALDELLVISRRNNAAHGITGMLLYCGLVFIQALEGPEAEVRRLFEKIKQDNRHESVILLLEEMQPSRNFADWTMGFERLLPDQPAPEGFSDFLATGDLTQRAQQEPRRAYRLLQSFRSLNLR